MRFSLLALLAASCAAAPAPFEPLDAALERYVEDGRLPGAAVLVMQAGEPTYERAVGVRDREAGDPLETDDVFRIASQTKAIVSVAIMMLEEGGLLSIGDPVRRFLPECAETTVEGGEPARTPITIRHLLTHTAGLGYGGDPAWEAAGITGWYFADREEPVRETVRRMAALPFPAHRGEEWVHGHATDVLGAAVEVASGTPLGVEDTHFYLPPEKRDRLTVVHSAEESSGLARAPDPGGMAGQGAYVEGLRDSFSGGAGLLSTAADYARFLEALRTGGAPILSATNVERMTSDQIGALEFGEEGVGFSLGFRTVADTGEFGWGGASHAAC